MENVPSKTETNSLPFVLMDRLDDDLIIQELEGRLPQILTYHFSDKGQEIWGLSKMGVDEATNELAKKGEVIRELEMTFTDAKDEGLFQVRAGRYAINKEGREILLDTKFGFKRQSKKTSTGKDNAFWYEQGAIKAARNASMRLIPASIKEAVIQYAKEKGKVKEVKENGQSEQKPKPQDAPGQEILRKVISEPMRKRFWAIAKSTKASDDAIKEWLYREYSIEHTKDIPRALYDEICERIKGDLEEKGE